MTQIEPAAGVLVFHGEPMALALGSGGLSRHKPLRGYSTVPPLAAALHHVAVAMENQHTPSTAPVECFCLERDSTEWNAAWERFDELHLARFGTKDRDAYNKQYCESWQYMGSIRTPHGAQHEFRHRMHPITNKREYLNALVENTGA